MNELEQCLYSVLRDVNSPKELLEKKALLKEMVDAITGTGSLLYGALPVASFAIPFGIGGLAYAMQNPTILKDRLNEDRMKELQKTIVINKLKRDAKRDKNV